MKTRPRLTRRFLLAGAFVLAGCSAKPPLQLTAASNGQTVEVRRGQQVVLELEANPSTGYRWEFLVPPAALRPLGDEVHKSEAKLGRVGGGGTTTWRFEAARAARDTLRMAYRRPWEANGLAAETFTCVLVVR